MPIIFSGWDGILRVFVMAVLAYLGLLSILRVSGKRTLSSLNAFDFVVTVALGSTLATVVLSRDIPLLEGIVAFATLVGAQYIISSLTVRSKLAAKLVKSSPRLLVHRGEMLADAMREERVTEEEIHSAIRGAGAASLADVAAVVLETNAELHVLTGEMARPASSMHSVKGFSAGGADRAKRGEDSGIQP